MKSVKLTDQGRLILGRRQASRWNKANKWKRKRILNRDRRKNGKARQERYRQNRKFFIKVINELRTLYKHDKFFGRWKDRYLKSICETVTRKRKVWAIKNRFKDLDRKLSLHLADDSRE